MPLSSETLELVKQTLIGGGYSLLLGAGASQDSRDRHGAPAPSGEELRKRLVDLKNIKPTSSLARAYAQLTPEEVKAQIIDPLSECIPGVTVQKITEFVWKRIYTLNVDDCLERAYSKPERKQRFVPLTQKSVYRNPDDASHVHIVHVHGWTHKPEDGFIFSLAEYAGGMGPGSPWINVLAQTITSEPFIIAGTNLEEPDLEYFLRGRSQHTVRGDRGPSFLVEPSPDAGTVRECDRHGLTLYEGTLLDFLSELDRSFPSRPLPVNASTGLIPTMFPATVTPRELALFSKNFSYVTAKSIAENSDLGFYVGREPTFNDIALNRDVARSVTNDIKFLVRARLSSAVTRDPSFILFEDNVGTGKSTIARRVAFDLASEGIRLFSHESVSSMDQELCAKVLNGFKHPFVLFCDNFADHSAAFAELYRRLSRSDFAIFGVERSYRSDHVRRTLGGLPTKSLPSPPFEVSEALSLIGAMEQHGLTAQTYTPKELAAHASDITTDSIAIAICRIMNDFRPLERIIESLMGDADNARLERYLACGLAAHCYRQGLYYPILASSFPSENITDQFNPRDVLPLAYTDRFTRDYVAPANPVLGQRLLREVVRYDSSYVFDIFCSLGSAIASYVDRSAIQRRTPEARIAGRLFDYDEVVLPFLGERCEQFYIRMKRDWEWNSRYWEQCALMKLDAFGKSGTEKNHDLLSQATSHARHAVKLEKHPLPLTTLGTVLIENMKHTPTRLISIYREVFDVLTEAIRLEGRMSRIAIHPYSAILQGTLNYVNMGGKLDLKQKTTLRKFGEDVERFFPYDSPILITLANLRPHLG